MSYKTNVLILNVYIVFSVISRFCYKKERSWSANAIKGFRLLAFHCDIFLNWLGSQNEFRMILFGIGIHFFL